MAAVDAAAIERGRLLFARDCRFVAGAADVAALPPPDLPEVAVAGRSNVGKSSLINALTGRTTLARTSRTPGRTRQLNFFELDGRLMLVDLPGYGFARAPKAEIARWSATIAAYLGGRASLRRLLVLVDARHGLKASDEAMLARADRAAVTAQVVLTKADALGPAARAARIDACAAALAAHPAAFPEVLATSARARLGLAELRAAIAALAAGAAMG